MLAATFFNYVYMKLLGTWRFLAPSHVWFGLECRRSLCHRCSVALAMVVVSNGFTIFYFLLIQKSYIQIQCKTILHPTCPLQPSPPPSPHHHPPKSTLRMIINYSRSSDSLNNGGAHLASLNFEGAPCRGKCAWLERFCNRQCGK